MIEWNDEMNIGILEIDEQHRELVSRFNQFAEAVEQGYTKESLVEILLFMGAYVVFHFNSEEELMREVGYPELDLHTRIHEEFMGKQYWLYESSRYGDVEVAREAVDFLGRWIVEHVAGEDKKISEWIAQIRPRV